MRVGLFGQFGSGNSGNDGSLEAMIASLQRIQRDVDLVCICPGTRVVEECFGIAAIYISAKPAGSRVFAVLDSALFGVPRQFRNFFWAFGQVRALNAIVVPGTGILDDFCETPFGWPYVLLRWCLAARLSGVPVYFLSIGAGPIRNPLSRAFMRTAIRMAAGRSYRDRLSRDFISDMGIDTRRDPVTCDIAFSLKQTATPPRPVSGPITVGVGVMTYTGWQKDSAEADAIYHSYLEKLQSFVSWLLAKGMRVRLLTGSASDGKAIRDLLEMLNSGVSNPALTAPAVSSLHEIMIEIARTDIVVATRYHNVVCALKMGRPTISLGYAEKNDELLQRTGLGDYCHNVETFESEVLKREVEEIVDHRFALGAEIRRAVDGFLAELDEQERQLACKLNELNEGNTRRLCQRATERVSS